MDEVKKLLEYCNDHKRIFCYGAGHYGRIMRAFLQENGVEIAGFIVTNIKCNTKTVLEAPVFSIDNFQYDKDGVGVIVSIAKSHRDELVENLILNKMVDYYCIEDSLIPRLENLCKFTRKYNSKNNITAFCFHRVANNPLDTWKITETTQLFAKQLEYFKKNYYILRSEEKWDSIGNKRAAIITFDDGYEDAYTNVLPLLEEYEVPATFFICTGNIGTDREFWWDELERIIFGAYNGMYVMNAFGEEIGISSLEEKEKACYFIHGHLKQMNYKDREKYLEDLSIRLHSVKKRDYCHSLNEEQLKALSKSKYVTIGGHTVTHSCLAYETAEEQEWEIKTSKKRIEEIIDKKIEVFSYPFGQRDDFTETTIEIAIKCGYKRIFTAYSGVANVNTPNGYIPRMNIGKDRKFEDGIRKLCLYESIYGDENV